MAHTFVETPSGKWEEPDSSEDEQSRRRKAAIYDGMETAGWKPDKKKPQEPGTITSAKPKTAAEGERIEKKAEEAAISKPTIPSEVKPKEKPVEVKKNPLPPAIKTKVNARRQRKGELY